MGLLKAMWDFAVAGAKLVVAVGTAAASALLWAVAHPVAAIVVGLSLWGVGKLIEAQPWAGSNVLGGMLTWSGGALLTVGIGSWITVQIIKATISTGTKVLLFLKALVQVPGLEASPLMWLMRGSGFFAEFGPVL